MENNTQRTPDPVAVPCKRCSGDASADTIYSYGRAVGYRVFCKDCDNYGPLEATQLGAVRAWNNWSASCKSK